MLIAGWPARVVIAVLAVCGFILALGDVLDLYDALWRISVPLTVAYAAVIWRFALSPARGQDEVKAAWPLGLDLILAKLLMTIALLLMTLGAIALGYDLFRLVADDWAYVVLAIALLAVVAAWAWIGELRRSGKRGRAFGGEGRDSS